MFRKNFYVVFFVEYFIKKTIKLHQKNLKQFFKTSFINF